MIDDLDAMINLQAWNDAVTRLAAAKAHEMQLRTAVFGQMFPTPRVGVNRAALGNGWELTAQHKVNITVDSEAAPLMYERLRKEFQIDPAPLFKWTPTIVVSVYNDLPENIRTVVDEILTKKPGAPSLEIVPPKATGV